MYDLNMKEIPFPDGLMPLDIFVSSISKKRATEEIEGRNGVVDYGTNYVDRSVELSMWINSADTIDYRLLRNEIYALFDTGNAFYIEETRVPSRVLKVAVDESFIPDRINSNVASVEVTCRTLDSVFWESKYTTLELHDSGYSATAEKYGLVDNIDDEKVKYRFIQDVKSNFIPKSDTRVAGNMSSWRPRGTNVTMNASVQTDSWYLLQVQNSGTYIATESDLLAFDLIAGEEYTLTYFAQPGASVTSMEYNWLIRSGQPNLKLPAPKVTLNHGIRTGTTYYNKYDITFTAEFTGKCSVLIGGNLSSGSNTFLYFSYPRLYKGVESKSWSEVIPDGGTTSFTVYNAGNVTVEPESMKLRIRFRNAKNLGEIKLVNKTTGETFSTTSDVGLTRHYEINGMVVKSGARNIFRDTNRRFIRLAPGINEFDFSGATFDSLDFNFKYLYR